MRSPAQAMLWQLGNRHRLGLSISAACLIVMFGAFPPLLRAFPQTYFFVVTLIPPVIVFVYVANLLLFTDEVGSLTTGYPRRMFTLPVRTVTLVFCPMIIAVVAVVSLWLLIAFFLYYPAGYRPPLVLPATALAVAMAWNQAIGWAPVRSFVVRALAAIIGYELFLGVPISLFIQKQATEATLTALGICELSFVCALTYLAVRHDRRGDDWTFGLAALIEAFWVACDRLTDKTASFSDPAAAQFWYECRCHGLMLKASSVFVLGSIFVMYMFVPTDKTLAFQIALGCMLAMPLILSGSQGASLGRMRPPWGKQQGMITFQAVRPMLTGDMVDAKYRMVARNVMQIWLIDLALTGALVLIKGQSGEVATMLRSFFTVYPGWRGGAILGLIIALAPIFTWKLLTDSLVPGLTGRRWIADGTVYLSFLTLMGLIAATLLVVVEPNRFHRLLPLLVWGMASLVVIKLIFSALGFRLALRRGFLGPRSVIRIVAIWIAMAAATMLLVHLLLPATVIAALPMPVISAARPVVLAGSLSLLPLGRFALAPLALEWNRRR